MSSIFCLNGTGSRPQLMSAGSNACRKPGNRPQVITRPSSSRRTNFVRRMHVGRARENVMLCACVQNTGNGRGCTKVSTGLDRWKHTVALEVCTCDCLRVLYEAHLLHYAQLLYDAHLRSPRFIQKLALRQIVSFTP